MADKAHVETDKKIEEIEESLRAIYSSLKSEIRKELEPLSKKYEEESERILEEYYSSKTVLERESAKKKYFFLFVSIFGAKEFQRISRKIVDKAFKANSEACRHVNEKAAGIYESNFNFIGESIKREIPDYPFIKVTEEQSEKFGELTKNVIKKAKDESWNRLNVHHVFLVCALTLTKFSKVPEKVSEYISQKNFNSSKMNASGIATDAETKGREDGMLRASDYGIVVQKKWLSTLDNRTRYTHRQYDGVILDMDEEFAPGLSRPRDPHGEPHEICNCRCTITYWLPGLSQETPTRASRSGYVKGTVQKSSSFRGTHTQNIPNMNYPEWAAWRGRNVNR